MRKAGAVGGVLIAAVVLGVASFAWACTNFARVDAINPPADAPRSEVTVRGAGVGPNALVQLRWNALDGQVIGSAAADGNGGFSVKGLVPANALPGVYSVIAVAGQTGVGRAAFEVTAPAGTTAVPALTGAGGINGADSGLWKGFSSNGPGLDGTGSTNLPVELGFGILAVGLAALATGAAVATVRRRRLSVDSRL